MGDIVRRFRHQHPDRVLDLDGLTGAHTDFRRRLRGRGGGDLQLCVELETPCLQLLEEDVERHYLRHGGGIAGFVGVARIQNLVRVRVDNVRRIALVRLRSAGAGQEKESRHDEEGAGQVGPAKRASYRENADHVDRSPTTWGDGRRRECRRLNRPARPHPCVTATNKTLEQRRRGFGRSRSSCSSDLFQSIGNAVEKA